MKILCIGDSLTFGYGVNHNDSWVSKLNNFNLSTLNKGVNGDTSIGILSRIYTDLSTSNADTCLILCGTNDILMGKPLESIIENIDLMIKDCNTFKITPTLMSPPLILGDLALKYWDSSLDYLDINNKIKDFSLKLKMYSIKNNIKFIDITSFLSLKPSNYTDGLHLSVEGNMLIAELIKKELS